MTLTFDGDMKDVWDSFYLYYEELGCYFKVTHVASADYNVKFPAYKASNIGFAEYILHTDISIFSNTKTYNKTDKDYREIVKDAIKQITEIGQRNMLPQQSNIMPDLIDIIFTSGKVFKVKE